MRRLLVALAAAVVLAAAGAAPAQAELKAIWGPNALPDGSSAFPTYQRLGVDVLERQVQWNLVAPTRPSHARNPKDKAYHWPSYVDLAAVEARRHGMRLALMLKGTPNWANGGQGSAVAPTHDRTYANFAIAAARHYRHVRLWMVWGEPARPGNFLPMPPASPLGAERYAKLLDRAYGALKSVRRSNVVIGGMTFNGQLPSLVDWLRWMRLPDGRPPRLDWFGHNPYGVRYPSLASTAYNPVVRDMGDVDTYSREIRRVYARIHRKPKLWLSEFNVQSDHRSWGFSYYVSRTAQARWLTAAYRIAHSEPYVAGLGWFQLLDERGRNGLTGGLMTWKGNRKPAWKAYRRAR